MFQNHKKRIVSILVFILIGIISWFALFEYGMRWIKKELASAEMDLKQQGYEISYSSLEFKGNPFLIKATLQNPHIKDPNGHFDWQGSELKVSMKPWDFYTLTFTLPGDQKVSLPLKPSLSLEVLKVEGGHGTLTLTRQGTLDEIFLSADRLSAWTGGQPHPIFLQTVFLKTQNLSHPLNLHLSFKSIIGGFGGASKNDTAPIPLTLEVEAQLSGFQEKASFPHSLAEWRDGGGILEMSFVKLNRSPIVIAGEGTLTFDKDMYPLGSFSSRIEGHQEALALLVELGHLKKNNASIASFVLNLLSKSDEKGNKFISVPITLQNRNFSVGAIPLFKVGG